MDSPVTYLERRVQEVTKEYQAVQLQRAALVEREQALYRQIGAYQIALEAERAKAGIKVEAIKPETNKPIAASSYENKKKLGVSASAFIGEFLRTCNGEGTTYGAVRKELQDFGFKVHKNYPYVVISKLMRDGDVEEREGKLFWRAK